MSEVVRVKREGGRGHHLIARAKYDPAIHELVDPPLRDPLDHDADGKKGGSLPAAKPRGRRKKAVG